MKMTLSANAMEAAALLRKRISPTAGVTGVGISTLLTLTKMSGSDLKSVLVELEDVGFISITFNHEHWPRNVPSELRGVTGVVVGKPLQQFFDALEAD